MKVRLPERIKDGIPVVETRLGKTPDAQAYRALQSGDAARWDEVARALGFPSTWDAVVSTYFVELAKDPSRAISNPTPQAIKSARDRGVRWLRIAVYANLAGEGTVKTLYAQATGIDPATTYIGKGRFFGEAREGTKSVKDREFQATVKAARKAGSRGDAKTAGIARKRLDQRAAADAKRKAKAAPKDAS